MDPRRVAVFVAVAAFGCPDGRARADPATICAWYDAASDVPSDTREVVEVWCGEADSCDNPEANLRQLELARLLEAMRRHDCDPWNEDYGGPEAAELYSESWSCGRPTFGVGYVYCLLDPG